MMNQPDSTCVIAIVLVVGAFMVLMADKWSPGLQSGACSMLSAVKDVGTSARAVLRVPHKTRSDAGATPITPQAKPANQVNGGEKGLWSKVMLGAQKELEEQTGARMTGISTLDQLMRGEKPKRSSCIKPGHMQFNIPEGWPGPCE